LCPRARGKDERQQTRDWQCSLDHASPGGRHGRHWVLRARRRATSGDRRVRF
jgi:hypothetical protein